MTGFFPGQKYGGPPVSVDNFCSLLHDNEYYIVTRNRDLGEKTEYKNINKSWNDRGNCKVLYLPDKNYTYKTYKKVINEISPDLIYLQGLFQNCILPCLYLAKLFSIPVLLAPRGELCKGAFKKKYKKLPYIYFAKFLRLFRNISYQSTSPEETSAIKKYLGAKDDNIYLLTNIPKIVSNEFNYEFKKSGIAKIVFLSRIVPKKNLSFALEILREVKGLVKFDIYGSLENQKYWNDCKKIISNLPTNVNVTFKGNVPHDRVPDILSKYDVLLFPTLSENYGHVILEALSVGCPIIISDQTPWNDINKYKGGWAIKLSEKESYIHAIQTIIDNSDADQIIIRNNAKDFFNKIINITEIKKNYYNALNRIIMK